MSVTVRAFNNKTQESRTFQLSVDVAIAHYLPSITRHLRRAKQDSGWVAIAFVR